jgi:hypothetical protein
MTVHVVDAPKFAIIPMNSIDNDHEWDAEFYDDIDGAKDIALEWSIELHGQSVAVLELNEEDDYELIYEISA